MSIQPGTYRLGPDDGDLLLHTTCEGPAARLGHELTLIVRNWAATLELGDTPEATALTATVDLTSLVVKDSRGGAKSMTDTDRRDIERNAQKSLATARHPEAAFAVSGTTGSWTEGEVTGDLTLHGRTEPVTFQVIAAADGFRLGGELRQTVFGIGPYSAMMGALRLGDSVLVEVTVTIPGLPAD